VEETEPMGEQGVVMMPVHRRVQMMARTPWVLTVGLVFDVVGSTVALMTENRLVRQQLIILKQ